MVRADTHSLFFLVVNLKIVGVVSGCITVALLIAVIAVTVVVIGMRWHKYQMKGKHITDILL